MALQLEVCKDVPLARITGMVPVAERGAPRRAGQLIQLLVIDHSGSMSGSAMVQVNTALKYIAARLRDANANASTTQLHVIAYNSDATLYWAPNLDALSLTATGMTNFCRAFDSISEALMVWMLDTPVCRGTLLNPSSKFSLFSAQRLGQKTWYGFAL